jgi:hypothetical protein
MPSRVWPACSRAVSRAAARAARKTPSVPGSRLASSRQAVGLEATGKGLGLVVKQ